MRHAAMLWGNVKRELGKFLTKVFVGGSLTGIGTEADPIELKGDAESPGNKKYYGTDGSGNKGYHNLPEGGGGGGSFDITDGTETVTIDPDDEITLTGFGVNIRVEENEEDSTKKEITFEADIEQLVTGGSIVMNGGINFTTLRPGFANKETKPYSLWCTVHISIFDRDKDERASFRGTLLCVKQGTYLDLYEEFNNMTRLDRIELGIQYWESYEDAITIYFTENVNAYIHHSYTQYPTSTVPNIL